MRTKFYLLVLITLPILGVNNEKIIYINPSWGNFGYYYQINDRINDLYFFGVINRWERRNLINDLIFIRRFEIRAMRDGFISFGERNRLNQLRRRLEIRLRQLEQRMLFTPFGNGFWDDGFAWNNNGWYDDFDDGWGSPWGGDFGFRRDGNNGSIEKNRSGDSIRQRRGSLNHQERQPNISNEEVLKRKAEIQKEEKIDWENMQ